MCGLWSVMWWFVVGAFITSWRIGTGQGASRLTAWGSWCWGRCPVPDSKHQAGTSLLVCAQYARGLWAWLRMICAQAWLLPRFYRTCKHCAFTHPNNGVLVAVPHRCMHVSTRCQGCEADAVRAVCCNVHSGFACRHRRRARAKPAVKSAALTAIGMAAARGC